MNYPNQTGSYRFNTCRLTYRYTFYDRGPWELGAGLAGLIRDAKVQNASVFPIRSATVIWDTIHPEKRSKTF